MFKDFLFKKYKCDEGIKIIIFIPSLLALLDIFGIDTITKSGNRHEASFVEGIYLLIISLLIHLVIKYKCKPWIIYKCIECKEVFDERKLQKKEKKCIFCESENIEDVKIYYYKYKD